MKTQNLEQKISEDFDGDLDGLKIPSRRRMYQGYSQAVKEKIQESSNINPRIEPEVKSKLFI